MSETNERRLVVDALKSLDAFSVENVVGLGTPDVNYRDGWIELKVLDHWPRREDTPVRIDHYTPQQRVRAVKRSEVGGKIYMLILVEETHEWVLLDGRTANELISSHKKTIAEGTQATVRERAITVWKGNKEMKENIVQCLSN